jgi:hypothetical protein
MSQAAFILERMDRKRPEKRVFAGRKKTGLGPWGFAMAAQRRARIGALHVDAA